MDIEGRAEATAGWSAASREFWGGALSSWRAVVGRKSRSDETALECRPTCPCGIVRPVGRIAAKGHRMSIKAVVADDHEVVRRGLASLLLGSGIEIVAEATNGEETVEKTLAHRPDVLLLDVRMPDHDDGLKALEQIRASYLRRAS